MPDKTIPPHVEKLARLAYNAAVGNKSDDGWWDKFSESEREEWRLATLAILSTALEPSEAEIEAAEAAFVESQEVNASVGLHDVYRKDIRAALIAAARARVGAGT